MRNQLWTVILAAGAGRRLADVTGGVPKQFWRDGRSPSLLDRTMDRFAPLAPFQRTVVIIGNDHVRHAGRIAGTRLVLQPQDCGTAAGVLLALTPVLDQSPDALVAVTPSDHGVIDEAAFRRGVMRAARHVRSSGGVVVFGVEPDEAHADYGWMTLEPDVGSTRFRRVAAFVEKPPIDVAGRLLEAGAVWNTMVTVSRASTLRDLYGSLLPELWAVFESALRLKETDRAALLAKAYPTLPRADFSRDLLTRANLLAYVWSQAVGWSDLGTPERLRAWNRMALSAPSRAA